MNEKINSSVLLLMFIDHKYRLNYSVMTVFPFSGHKGRFYVIEWMNSHKACRGLLLHHFSRRYFFFFLIQLLKTGCYHFLNRKREKLENTTSCGDKEAVNR